MITHLYRLFVLLLALTSYNVTFAQLKIKMQTDKSMELLTVTITNLSDSLYCHFGQGFERERPEMQIVSFDATFKGHRESLDYPIFRYNAFSDFYTLPPGESIATSYLYFDSDTVDVFAKFFCFTSNNANPMIRTPKSRGRFSFNMLQTITRDTPVDFEACLPLPNVPQGSVVLTNLQSDKALVYTTDKKDHQVIIRPGETKALRNNNGVCGIKGSYRLVAEKDLQRGVTTKGKSTGSIRMSCW